MTAPAASNWSTTVALKGLVYFSKMPDPQVVGKSRVQILSLIDIRRPSMADFGVPAGALVAGAKSSCDGGTLFLALVGLPYTVLPWASARKRCYEGIEFV